MLDGLFTWLERGPDQGLSGLEELAPDRTVLLLTGLVQWRITHLAVPLLHLVLRDHPLSSWPAEGADAIVRACQAFEKAYRNRPVDSTPSETSFSAAGHPRGKRWSRGYGWTCQHHRSG